MALAQGIGIGLSALSTLPNWYRAWKQDERADELAKDLVRPDMAIPQSEVESLKSAEAQAGMTRLPGQSAIEGRLDQSTSNLISQIERAGTGGSGDINAASRAYGMQQEKENELGVNAGNMWLHNQDILRNELDQNAEWQQKAWEWNKKEPYENTARAIGALRESSARNFDTGWKDLLGGGANLALGEYLKGTGADFGKTAPAGGDNSSFSGSAYGMTADPLQNGETQQNLSGFSPITNDPIFNVDRKPIFSSFDLGGSFTPRFTARK